MMEILSGDRCVHGTNNLHFLAGRERAPLTLPMLNALSITGMASAAKVVDEPHLVLVRRKVNVSEL